jgi:hypothetical protein
MKFNPIARIARPRSNPLSQTNKVVLGLAALGGVAALYYAFKSSSSSSATGGGTTAPAGSTFILAPGTYTINVPTSGFTLSLPSGATWTSTKNTGTSAPLYFPPLPAQSVQSYPITWKDSSGATQTTTLTVNVVAA